jgi:hypothetical protein
MTPQFLFAPMFGRHVMSDSAASYGAHNRMVAGTWPATPPTTAPFKQPAPYAGAKSACVARPVAKTAVLILTALPSMVAVGRALDRG